MTTDETIRKYQEVLLDIHDNYSTAQILGKRYKIEGRMQFVDEDTIRMLRHTNKDYKRKKRVASLAGFDAQEMYPEIPNRMMKQESTSDYPGMPATVETAKGNTMQTYIENAELKAELRYNRKELEDLKSKVARYETEGLGSIEEKTQTEFLRRDYADLKSKHEKLRSEYEKLLPELEEYQEEARGLEKIKGYAEMASANKDLIRGIVSMVNPELGQRMGLAGLEEGTGAQNPQTQKAVEIGQLIINNFQGKEFEGIQFLINNFFHHREMIEKCVFTVQTLIENKMAQAQSIASEETEEFNNAKSI